MECIDIAVRSPLSCRNGKLVEDLYRTEVSEDEAGNRSNAAKGPFTALQRA